jgi:hypothetical protein
MDRTAFADESGAELIKHTLKDVFPFERTRCDRLVGRLLNQLAQTISQSPGKLWESSASIGAAEPVCFSSEADIER